MIPIQEIERRYTLEMGLAILLCRVFFKKAPDTDIDRYLSEQVIDWHFFEQIIAAHQLRPLVFKTLSGKKTVVPPDFYASLRDECLSIAQGNLHKMEELVRLHRLLREIGVKHIAYKGVILSRQLFHDFISRETSDIDFLISPQDFARVHQLLIRDGYRPRYYNPDFEQQLLDTSHELLYRKQTGSGAVKIEMHWAATSRMLQVPLRNDFLFGHLTTMMVSGEALDVFDLDTHLLVLLVHHGVNDVWRSLKHVVDIAAFHEKYLHEADWASILAVAAENRIAHTTRCGFSLAAELFGIDIPAGYQAGVPLPGAVLDNLLRYPVVAKSKLNMTNLKQQLYLRDSGGDRLRLILAYLATGLKPNIRDMEALALPEKWYFLYYVLKPFRILMKKDRRKGK